MTEESLPAGRVAFYIGEDDNELHYSVVKVKGRYADDFDVIELPRGDPDDFFVNSNLPDTDPKHRIVVERSKEGKALDALGINYEGDPIEALKSTGYEFERTETLQEAAMRELEEEHGFDQAANEDMVKQVITMNPFPVAASYGANKEYRDFVQIDANIDNIPLHVTDKTETKAPARMGVPYQEAGGWATLKQIRQNAQDFVELAEADQTQDRERLLGEAYYQKSIADWMESAEAALVGTLRKSGTSITTSTTVDPARAMRQTGANVESSGRFESP